MQLVELQNYIFILFKWTSMFKKLAERAYVKLEYITSDRAASHWNGRSKSEKFSLYNLWASGTPNEGSLTGEVEFTETRQFPAGFWPQSEQNAFLLHSILKESVSMEKLVSALSRHFGGPRLSPFHPQVCLKNKGERTILWTKHKSWTPWIQGLGRQL